MCGRHPTAQAVHISPSRSLALLCSGLSSRPRVEGERRRRGGSLSLLQGGRAPTTHDDARGLDSLFSRPVVDGVLERAINCPIQASCCRGGASPTPQLRTTLSRVAVVWHSGVEYSLRYHNDTISISLRKSRGGGGEPRRGEREGSRPSLGPLSLSLAAYPVLNRRRVQQGDSARQWPGGMPIHPCWALPPPAPRCAHCASLSFVADTTTATPRHRTAPPLREGDATAACIMARLMIDSLWQR